MEAKRTSLLMIIMVICTVTIIGTNYIFTKGIVTDLNNSLMENEYKKIGGKENYLIMQEIQKREILSYLDNIKNENPGLIKDILARNKIVDSVNNNILYVNTLNDLKKDTYIKGNSGALVSIIEFSDLECPYCIKQHNSGMFDRLLKEQSDNVNYIFKNFPLPSHKNATKEAEAAKCVEKLSNGENYLEYIGTIFETTKGGGEGYKIEELPALAEKMGISKNSFNKCLDEQETSKTIEKEFVQARLLGIDSAPTTMVINNETGEYKMISGVADYDEIKNTISELTPDK